MNIMVEGLSEEPAEKIRNKVTQLCNCIGLDLGPDDIVSAYRIVRCNLIKDRPNPARVIFRDLPSKEKFMINKGILNKHEKLQSIWINHDEPMLVGRAKGRSRHIATYARKKGFSAQLNANGIILDNVFYSY